MVTSYWSFLMDGDVLPHEIIRCGMQRAQPSPCTMPVQYNAMPVQCNAMVAQRTRPCTILWLQGSSARKNLWSLWSLWSLDKGVSEGELWALCGGGRIFVRRRKNLATWLIYYSGCTPLHTMGCLISKDLENRYCEIWFIWCMLQCQ